MAHKTEFWQEVQHYPSVTLTKAEAKDEPKAEEETCDSNKANTGRS